jgi:hypothetical protein
LAGWLALGGCATVQPGLGDGSQRRTEDGFKLLRQAWLSYQSDHPLERPETLREALLPGMGTQYLEEIPADGTGSSRVVPVWDGYGGWTYDRQSGEIGVNQRGVDSAGRLYKDYNSTYPAY